MDYITARCFVVNNLDRAKLGRLHKFENEVFEYAKECRKKYKKDKVTPPLWWEAGYKFLQEEFEKAAGLNGDIKREIRNFTLEILSRFPCSKINKIYNNIKTMHEIDILASQLPFNTPHTT